VDTPLEPLRRFARGAHAPGAECTRTLWQILKLALAALLAYAIWCAYQNPDLLLDLSGWRLC
jgi:hypothetical protein